MKRSRFSCVLCFLLIVPALATASTALCADEFPAELVRFRPYERNPVFVAGAAGQWDERIRERGWILREGDVWKLWYTGYDGTPAGTRHAGYATSPDGLAWTRSERNPIDREGWVEDMQVLRYGDTYLMFAEGERDQAQWLSSRDGLQWKHEGRLDVRNTDGMPLTAGAYGTPTVWFENGVWSLFYERSDNGVWLARSTDLMVWANVQDEPVMSPGPEAYDHLQIALNQIIKHNGRYYAYYHGSGTIEKPRVWTVNVAVSTDLIHWKKYPGNPLLPAPENKSSGIVINDGRQYRLYTTHEKVDVHLAEPPSSPVK